MNKQALEEAGKRAKWTGRSPFACLKEVLIERGQPLDRALAPEELARLEGWATPDHPDGRQDDDRDRVVEPLPF